LNNYIILYYIILVPIRFPFHPRTNKFAQGKFSVIMKAESPTYLEEWGEEK
jgi:hypothetical protein